LAQTTITAATAHPLSATVPGEAQSMAPRSDATIPKLAKPTFSTALTFNTQSLSLPQRALEMVLADHPIAEVPGRQYLFTMSLIIRWSLLTVMHYSFHGVQGESGRTTQEATRDGLDGAYRGLETVHW
jgi:hypothetical protein